METEKYPISWRFANLAPGDIGLCTIFRLTKIVVPNLKRFTRHGRDRLVKDRVLAQARNSWGCFRAILTAVTKLVATPLSLQVVKCRLSQSSLFLRTDNSPRERVVGISQYQERVVALRQKNHLASLFCQDAPSLPANIVLWPQFNQTRCFIYLAIQSRPDGWKIVGSW